ncbi:unnamed protein product [Miscanthus lutarioriparius]|uniref:F-box domain-containing protein n=1 Tax=Miscanthus lutarioriparius TaxID=422564 RepID=A0A811SMB9_9POAL|nr:unnamed protein product [Miscanthus lutarioriparius]
MEGLVLDTVISRAGARPAAALACASTRLRTAVADDSLWRGFCAEDLGLDAPVDPEGQPLPLSRFAMLDPGLSFFSCFAPLSRLEQQRSERPISGSRLLILHLLLFAVLGV